MWQNWGKLQVTLEFSGQTLPWSLLGCVMDEPTLDTIVGSGISWGLNTLRHGQSPKSLVGVQMQLSFT